MEKEEQTIKDLVQQRFKELPKEIADSITESKWEEEIRKISEKHKLRVDQGNVLENQTLLLMLGLQDVEGYFKVLGENIDNTDDNLESILDEVESQIIGKVKNVILEKTNNTDSKNVESREDIKKRENFVKENVNNAASEDEILTVTRDEILQGIEQPEKEPNVSLETSPEEEVIPIQRQTGTPIPESNPVQSQSNIQPPTNLPGETVPKTENKPVNPVEAGLGSTVSTSKENYKGSDPYREPIE